MLGRLFAGKPLELTDNNPMKWKVGAFVVIASLDLRNPPPLRLRGVTVYKRQGANYTHSFVDYRFDDDRRLRVLPTEDIQVRQYLWLKTEVREPWDQGLHNALNDPTGQFFVGDEPHRETWTRINNLRGPHGAKVTDRLDRNGDHAIQVEEVIHRAVDYWDFVRPQIDAAGQESFEYLFVELCDQRKQFPFEFLRGVELASHRVSFAGG